MVSYHQQHGKHLKVILYLLTVSELSLVQCFVILTYSIFKVAGI